MDIREKLVELLCGVQDYGEKTKHLNGSYAFIERHDNRTIADHLIANDVTVQEWIPVSERLPEEDTRVLVWLAPKHYEYTNVDTDRRYRGRWVRWDSRVTHWMPLPQPPKGE